MPDYELAFPTGSKYLRVVTHEREYPLLVGTDTFVRGGMDGAEIISPLFGGDEFVGEVLEGQWLKSWDANLSGFTAILDGSGSLIMNGVAAVAGTTGYGWINGQHPFVMVDGAEVSVELEVPVSDTGAVADRDIEFLFFLKRYKNVTNPLADYNCLVFNIKVTEDGLIYSIDKEIDATWTTLFFGSDADGSTWDPAGDRFIIWRIVFHESHAGTTYRHIHAYLKHSTSFALVEAATEEELYNSPYDISDLNFTVSYPSYFISSQHATYFNSANDAVSHYCRVTYPNMSLRCDLPEPKSLYLDGVATNYVERRELCHDFPILATDNFTVSFWLYLPLAETDGAVFYMFGYSGPAGSMRCLVQFNSNIYWWGNGAGDVDSGIAFNVGSWQLITVTWDGTNIRFYKNDALVSGPTAPGALIDSTACIAIGRMYGGNAGWQHNAVGYFDDFRLYNRTLSLAEVQAVYAGTPSKVGLVCWLPFDGNPYDYTEKENHVTLYGVPSYNYRYPTATERNYQHNSGEVKLFDTMGSATEAEWQRVYSVDHAFIGDQVIQNGLMRVFIDNGIIDGIQAYYYYEGAWTNFNAYLFFQQLTSTLEMRYYWIDKIIKATSEEVILKIHATDTSTDNDDYVNFYELRLKRGNYHFDITPTSVYPIQSLTPQTYGKVGRMRFGWAGEDVQAGDLDITKAGTSSTMPDNFLIAFDNDGPDILKFMSVNKKPTTYMVAYSGDDLYLDDLDYLDIPNTIVSFGFIPFSLIANLFEEAEDCTPTLAVRLHFDGAGEDTVTENNAAWTPNANTTEDENDAAAVSVGAKNIKWTSVAGGACLSNCKDAPSFNKSLLKFDYLKLYLSRIGAVNPASVTITLIDDDGDSVYISQAITQAKIQYIIPLPHSATDLQGWTQVGTYDWSKHDHLRIGWTALGAGEIVYCDGLHFYIGTTTARGRDEDLSGSSSVVLDAQNETIQNVLNTISAYLPYGRYLVLVRAKDTEQVNSDLAFECPNTTDSRYMNEENAIVYKTLTSSFAYYSEVLGIQDYDDNDICSTPRLHKENATENTIFVDYILIVPIGNCESFPQNLSHNSLRYSIRKRKVKRRNV